MLRAALLTGVLAALLAGCGGTSGPDYTGTRPPPGIHLPGFSLRDQSGRTVSSKGLVGKAVLVTFLDSACREACPPTAVAIGRALRLLTAEQRASIAALAVSMDPRVDNPRRVRVFVRREHAQGLTFLLGTTHELRPVWNAFHVLPAVDSGSSDVHTLLLEIYDRDGEWVSTLHSAVDLTAKNVHHDLVTALG